MQMRMVHQVLPPGVENSQETNLRAEMLWIGGDPAQRLGHRPEQDIVDHGLVLERDGGNLVRHGEHDMEVGHVEQFRLAVLQPLGTRQTLAFRAVPVAARVVRHTLITAIITLLDVTAESGGSAAFDRDHGALPSDGQRYAVLLTESHAEAAEHVRHFQPLAGHNRRSGGHEVWSCWGGAGVQGIQRTGRGADLAGGNLEVPSRGAQIAMAEQQLDGA